MIELKHVCAGYDGQKVVYDLSMKFEPGKVTVLTGPNGCGKSTLLKAMVRLNPHMSGDILIDEKRIQTLKTNDLAKKVAYLPQTRNIPDISVLCMVLHGRFPYLGYPRQYREEDICIARNALEWVGLSHLEEENVIRLSGGIQQQVYIAMIIAQDADTILMDEPTTYLDIAHQLQMMDMARKMAGEGKAVVMVLHDLPQALRTADYVYVMNKGIIEIEGTPADVYESGKMQGVFGVEIERIKSRNGYHYIIDGY